MCFPEPSSKASAELAAQLSAAKGDVGAAFYLAAPTGERRSRGGDDVEGVVLELLARATREAGAKPSKMTIQRNLGSFIVVGRPGLIEAILAQPEVSRAIPTHVDEDILIRPVKQTPVKVKRTPRGRKGA
jgi:hypothetical protein